MTYDDWKLSTPDEEPEFICSVCGKIMKSDSGVCSNVCFEADML